MSKTAMAEMIERLQDIHRKYPVNNALNRSVKGAYVDCVIIAKSLIEKEKQQIIEARQDGLNHEFNFKTYGTPIKDGEDYYNQTYPKINPRKTEHSIK